MSKVKNTIWPWEGTDLKDIQVSDVADGRGCEALNPGAGVAERGGVGGAAAAPHAAVARLMLGNRNTHSPGCSPLPGKARLGRAFSSFLLI